MFSIIIPLRIENKFLHQTTQQLFKQTYKVFEVIVITDKVAKSNHLQSIGPAYKRNFGAKIAKGEYLAFLDDDSYPQNDWLAVAHHTFSNNKDITAVCGPSISPPSSSNLEIASGLVMSSLLGSGAAGQYRNTPQSKRYVIDYPTVNFIVKKEAFTKINGFNTHYWPGEDTLLCRDIIKMFGAKSILYTPDLLVFHHRRKIGIPFLKQHARYGLHRGHFAKKFPENSLSIGYILPSIFTIYLFLCSLKVVPLHLLVIYSIFLVLQLIYFLYTKNNLVSSILATIFIPLTHIVYGVTFLVGLLLPNIHFSPHEVNNKTGEYIGG